MQPGDLIKPKWSANGVFSEPPSDTGEGWGFDTPLLTLFSCFALVIGVKKIEGAPSDIIFALTKDGVGYTWASPLEKGYEMKRMKTQSDIKVRPGQFVTTTFRTRGLLGRDGPYHSSGYVHELMPDNVLLCMHITEPDHENEINMMAMLWHFEQKKPVWASPIYLKPFKS